MPGYVFDPCNRPNKPDITNAEWKFAFDHTPACHHAHMEQPIDDSNTELALGCIATLAVRSLDSELAVLLEPDAK